MRQSHVRLPVPQQPLPLMRPTEQQFDGGRAGLRAVGVEQLGRQFTGRAGFDGQDEPPAA